MPDQVVPLACEVEVLPGEKLRLPSSLADQIGPGRWRITVQPATDGPVRCHAAFLNGYAPEDEGLYDEHPAR
jgi:hypothetical protein